MSSQISVHYHTDDGIINDVSTYFVPHIGDCVSFNGKEYHVKKVKNISYMNTNYWVNRWKVDVYLEPFNSDNIN